MPPKDVGGVCRRLFWDVRQVHMHILQFAPALAVIAGGTGGNQIGPFVRSPQVAGNDMVHGQVDITPAAILTGIIIPPEYFTAR